MNDGLDRVSIFIISFAVLLGVCAFFGLFAYVVHESQIPDPNKRIKIEACAKEERVEVRALCLAVVK